jgi:superfamily II DNA or RNA helicase
MNSIWESLSFQTLTDYIGDEPLHEIQEILPIINESEFSNLDDKRVLARIFDAIVGADCLQKKEFRHKIFNQLSPHYQSKLKINFDISDDSYIKFIDELIKHKWVKNEKNILVCQCLDLSEDSLAEEKTDRPSLENITKQDYKNTFKQLKLYQFPVVHKALSTIERTPLGNMMIQMPTGSGKTRVAMEIISEFINNYKGSKVDILWLAHSSELLEQARACFMEIWNFIGKKDISIINLWGKVKGYPHSETNCIIFAGFEKLHMALKKDGNSLNHYSNNLKLIIVDEAHRAIAPTYKHVIESMSGLNANVIGLSATPIRGNTVESESLKDFFDNELITIKGPNDINIIKYLRGIKVLSKVERECLDGIDISASTQSKSYYEKYFDISPEILKRLSHDASRNINIINKVVNLVKQNKQIMIFACSVAHSKLLSSALTLAKINNAHIDGNTPMSRREKKINEFRNKDINVISNYELLSTGFDAPQVDVVMITRPTFSSVLYSQMIGRGLRGPAMGGTESCQVVEVIDNIDGYPDTSVLFEQFEEIFKADLSD